MAVNAGGVIAVLDVGKTNVKVALFDRSGTLFTARDMPNRPVHAGEYPHADVEAIWTFALDAFAALNRDARIGAVVVTTHGAAGALVDDSGLVLPVMDYEWPGPESAARYAAERPAFEESFSPDMPLGLNLGRQLAWQEDHYPDRVAAARWFMPYPQYWAWRLSGVVATEVTSLGCHTDLWAPFASGLSSIVRRRGWDRLMPPLRRAWDVLGPIRPEIAARTGLDPATPIHVGVHDSNASLVPHLVNAQPPFTVLSTGTWAILMAVGGPAGALNSRADMLVNVDVAGRPVPTARFMGGREHAAIAGENAPPATLDDVAAVVASGALALPCFAGQGGPYADRPGSVTGTLPERPGARAALASLYVALMADEMLDRLGAFLGPLIVEGRFASNPAFLGLLAALRQNQMVFSAPDTSGTALGASLLASWRDAPTVGSRSPVARGPVPGLRAYRARWRDATAGLQRPAEPGGALAHGDA